MTRATPTGTVDRLLQEGLDFYQSGLVDHAVAAWTEALHVQPDDPRAREYLRKAGVSVDETDSPVPMAGTRAELEQLLAERRYEEALELLFAARRQNPTAPEISRGIQLLKQRLVRRYLHQIGNLDHVPRLAMAENDVEARFPAEEERELLRLVDGISSFGDIAHESRLGRFETFRILAKLVAAEVITQAVAEREEEDDERAAAASSSPAPVSITMEAELPDASEAGPTPQELAGETPVSAPLQQPRRRHGWMVLLGGAAVAAVGLLVWTLLDRGDTAVSPESTAATATAPSPPPTAAAPVAAAPASAAPTPAPVPAPAPEAKPPEAKPPEAKPPEPTATPAANPPSPPSAAAAAEEPEPTVEIEPPAAPTRPARPTRAPLRPIARRNDAAPPAQPAAPSATEPSASPSVAATADPTPSPIPGPSPGPPAEATPSATAPTPAPTPPPAPPPPPAVPTRLDATAAVSSESVAGALTRSEVDRALQRLTPALHACYVGAAVRAGKNVAATVHLTFTIDETGLAQSPAAGSAPLPGLSDCLRDALRQLRTQLAPDVGIVHVAANVTFSPPGP